MADSAAVAGSAEVKLNDLMLAMDVVDTLRHQEAFVARELDEEGREQELTARLRKIYRDQGIEVSDAVIAEGVKALKDSRFVYTPPRPGLGVTLARLWVRRGRVGAFAAGLLGLFGLAWIGYYILAERPAQQRQIELSTNLPKALEAAYADASAEAKAPAARDRAAELLADGRRAAQNADPAAAKSALDGLKTLSADLRQSYQIRVVASPGEKSGVFRIPDRNTNARNYYLIVEAVGADGQPIALPIKSEEDGTTKMTTKWGLRVDKQTYDRVGADKADDGIIQNRTLGEKRRGFLDVDYSVPASGAAITQW
ncbi:conserved hypothetical protein [Methylocella silvestris BL2]|uniref:Uncharacterized protein n=1 Tax=Methylocella silvestris (strain DSM 15510 / CIP 108128 / LMG 27833 / NCIMB 13906 / BL2) TaxID=395965 RepID=B8ERD6_METSB|nr:DUF6384 family protein [Methylocella silvestris]ACK50320.1 conserved hypothetical protein [Methylocella silvestris BL2]